jgi:hypothetical protein
MPLPVMCCLENHHCVSRCRDAKQHLNEDLDLFVVNSFSSLSQCLFVFLLLPAMTAARG